MGLTVVHAPRISEGKFAELLRKYQSPAAPLATGCYHICVECSIDPAVALAFFAKESTFGRYGVAVQTKSWGNMRRPWKEERSTGSTSHPFAIYPDWQTSLRDWCEYLRGFYVEERGLETVEAILPVYAPSSENDTEHYISQVRRWVATWQEEDTEMFLYEGIGLTPAAFAEYVADYDFGPLPPDFVVLHHTAIPDSAEAPIDHNPANDWQGTYEERKARLDNIKNYYERQLGWDRGPHLFIDEERIWIFTPMFHEGIHAGHGNSFWRDGTWGYSIGIEVIGFFDKVQWSDAVARNVAHAVCVLRERLGTFDLEYKAWSGGISMHRDYTREKTCPGLAITPDYFIPLFRSHWDAYFTDAPEPTCTMRYRVRDHISNNSEWNRAVIRTGPTTQAAIATHLEPWWLEPGEAFEVRAIVADCSGGTGRWLHLGGDRDEWGFVHESLARRDGK
jgi:hypothetical protein